MDNITYDDFAKLDFRVGKIVQVEEVPESSKLLKLTVDFGELGEKTVFSGIKKWYEGKDLKDKNFVFLFNLEPRAMMGAFSEAMIIAAEDDEGNCVLLIPDKDILPGTKVH
jgi:methionine--tRNA ligase beta chain